MMGVTRTMAIAPGFRLFLLLLTAPLSWSSPSSSSSSSSAAALLPCDVLSAAGNPCVAAHSTTRRLRKEYAGPLYEVRRASDNATQPISCAADSDFADAAAQESFCSSTDCAIVLLLDQSGLGNSIATAPGGPFYSPLPDAGVNASKAPLVAGGQRVYGAYFEGKMGYRNDSTAGVPKGDDPETIYMLVDGGHFNDACCFDYGNAEVDNHDDGVGTMEAAYFGSSANRMSHHGSGDGPWVMVDLENGLWSSDAPRGNPDMPSLTGARFLTALVKGGHNTLAIKAGEAGGGRGGGGEAVGALATLYDGERPERYKVMRKQGAIILGIGGDNSNGAVGSFYEGAIARGFTTDATDNALHASIIAAGYADGD